MQRLGHTLASQLLHWLQYNQNYLGCTAHVASSTNNLLRAINNLLRATNNLLRATNNLLRETTNLLRTTNNLLRAINNLLTGRLHYCWLYRLFSATSEMCYSGRWSHPFKCTFLISESVLRTVPRCRKRQ